MLIKKIFFPLLIQNLNSTVSKFNWILFCKFFKQENRSNVKCVIFSLKNFSFFNHLRNKNLLICKVLHISLWIN